MERRFDPDKYEPRPSALTKLGDGLVLPLFQGYLAVSLGVSARKGNEDSRLKIEKIVAQNERMGLAPWWLTLSRKIAGM